MEQLNWQKIKLKIKEHSFLLKIDKIGFASAEPFKEIESFLIQHRNKGFYSGFEEKDIKLRIDPSLSLPEVKSIISIALAYPSREPVETKKINSDLRGRFCRASWGRDYHYVVKEKLDKLANYIKSLVPQAKTLSMVDTGPLSERAVAVRAGIGWIGKNGNLITPEFGSFVYLGELLTNLPLPPDKSIDNKCGTCEICKKACPMKAIENSGMINCTKCLAYQTLNKGFLTEEIKENIGKSKQIYGCDICQLVCPFNKDKLNDWHKEFNPEYELINPSIKSLLNLSNKEFKNIYGNMSGSWRGKKVLQRNGILILGQFRDPAFIPILKEKLFSDPNPGIREAAAWALSKYNLTETRLILEESLKNEDNNNVKNQIKRYLN